MGVIKGMEPKFPSVATWSVVPVLVKAPAGASSTASASYHGGPAEAVAGPASLAVGARPSMGLRTMAHVANAATAPLPFRLPSRIDLVKIETELAKLSKSLGYLLQFHNEFIDRYLMTLWMARHYEPPENAGDFARSTQMGAVAWELARRIETISDVIDGGVGEGEGEGLLAMAIAGMLPRTAFAVGDWLLVDRIFGGLNRNAIPVGAEISRRNKKQLEAYYIAAMSTARLAEQFHGRRGAVLAAVRVLLRTISSLHGVPDFPAKRMTDLVEAFGRLAVREDRGMPVFRVDPRRPEIIEGIKVMKDIGRVNDHDCHLAETIRRVLDAFAALSTMGVPRIIE